MATTTARSGSMKSGLWVIRALQFLFAVILTGVFAYFHRQISRAGYIRYYEADVPLGFSVAAIVISILAMLTHFAFADDANILIAILDTLLFIGFIASAVVYRHNFNTSCNQNTFVRVFNALGKKSCNLVRLGAALLIFQVLLFFASMILSHRLARRRQAVATTPGLTEEKSRFGFRRRDNKPVHAV